LLRLLLPLSDKAH